MCMTRRGFGRVVLGGAAALAGHERARAEDLADHEIICGRAAYPRFRKTTAVRKAPPEAYAAVRLILDSVGLTANFEILAGRFSAKVGGFATMRSGRRYIVYDEEEFAFGDGRTDWDAMGLLCHEIGHHLSSHLFRGDTSGPDEELEADRFAGFALGRLGASERQALIWTQDLYASETPTHPARPRRQAAAREGWALAEEVKRRERPACALGWIGDAFDLDARRCRMARTCVGGTVKPRLTCEDVFGEWRWMSE